MLTPSAPFEAPRKVPVLAGFIQPAGCAVAVLLLLVSATAQTQVPLVSVPWSQVNVSGCGTAARAGTQINLNQIAYPVQPSLPQLARPKAPLPVSMAGPSSPKKLTAAAIALNVLTPQCWPVQLQSNAWSVINTYCIRCHGYDAPWYDTAGVAHLERPDSLLTFALTRAQVGNLDLRSYATIVQGGTSGPALIPGHSALSLLFTTAARALLTSEQISASGLSYPVAMPPAGPLQPTEVSALQQWIDAGAPMFSGQ
jgi:hypothetical protein